MHVNEYTGSSSGTEVHKVQGASEEERDLERLKRLYLKAQDGYEEETFGLRLFYESAVHRYTSGIMIDPEVPDAMQRVLQRDILSFDGTMAKALSESALRAFDKPESFKGALLETQESVLQNVDRLSNILWRHDLSFRGYLALRTRADYRKYLFLSERTEGSCFRCESLHGRLLTLDELAGESALPPLHPNCKCRLVAIDSAAEYLYNVNKEGFVRRLDRLFDEEGLGGGLFTLSHGLQSLSPLPVQELPAVSDGEHSDPEWYEKLGEWAEKFGADLVSFLDAFFTRGESLVANASEVMEEDFLAGMLLWADALTGGIISGLHENFLRNHEIWSEDPSAYNFLNLYLHGLPDMLTGWLFPEEFMSFQHVMDIIGVSTIFVGAAKIIGKGSLDDAARAAVGTIDDTLDDIARRNGKVQAVLSADDLNSVLKKSGFEPSYVSGTKVYRIEYTGKARFVRVYGGRSGQIGRWFMNADDIAGLTAEQIKDKFSLPQTPTYICDISVPSGTVLEVSAANGVMGGRGGGVQYRFISEYNDSFFTNARPLS